MKFSDLKKHDPSLNLQSGDEGISVFGICNANRPAKEKFAFVKNAKFLAKFFAASAEAKIGLVVPEIFLRKNGRKKQNKAH